MTKLNATILVILGLFISSCATSQTSARTSLISVSSAELTGTYDCFAINGANNSNLGTLTINPDQTATFGGSSIRWQYEAGTNMIIFDGNETLRDAIYFSEGQTLSINENSDDHFTCVKSGQYAHPKSVMATFTSREKRHKCRRTSFN